MHKAFGIYVHITWHTWRRRRVVDRSAAVVVLNITDEAATRCRVHVHEKAVLSDHVHVIVSIRPDITISSFVRHAKSESARRINRLEADSSGLADTLSNRCRGPMLRAPVLMLPGSFVGTPIAFPPRGG
jgi:putative transposase